MKIILTFIFGCVMYGVAAHVSWDDESRISENELIVFWETKLKESKLKSEEERIKDLWLGLRNLGIRRTYEGHNPEASRVFSNIQHELISIPGHAEYHGKRIRDAYEPLKGHNPATAINPAQSEMMYGFSTLKHLPSPETVRVLGGMLSETWQMPPTGDYTPPALAQPSMIALGDLSIRNAPWKPIQTTNDMPGAISAWQAWWEEIKSGRLTFSFKGQAVEYRFKPDGTWETMPISNPPDDGPQPAKITPIDRPNKQTTSTQKESQGTPHDSSWWLYGIAGVVLLAAGGWLWSKKQT